HDPAQLAVIAAKLH
ncbi:hypothetical protein, partial [Klebsiella pneumoniae]